MATSLKIDNTLKSRVQHLASQRRRSPHWIMLEAIQQYVEREEARESFKQEALASWSTYQGNWPAPDRPGSTHLVEHLGHR
jgi:predicted transcriptional regulator